MLSPQKDRELRELLWALRDGNLTLEQVGRLDRMVCQDADARSLYVRYVHLFAGLHWCGVLGNDEQTASRCREMFAGAASTPGERVPPARSRNGRAPKIPAAQGDTSPPVPSLSADVTLRMPDQSSSRTIQFSMLAAAAFLGAVLAVLAFWIAPMPRRQAADRGPLASEPPSRVARLTDEVACTWAGTSAIPRPGDLLEEGRTLTLVRGLAEITFQSGVKVILQGPATFVVESDTAGYLHAGTLTARVPPEVTHFVVRTPGVEVTDLGTEFGLHVQREGVVDMHVFQGRVEVTAKDASGRVWIKKRLAAKEGAQFDPQGAMTSRPAPDPRRFARSMPTPGEDVRFFFDEAAWLAVVGEVQRLRTTSENVARAKEVGAPPERDTCLGPTLTFAARATGLGWGFRLQMVQPGRGPDHGFVFNDSSGNPKMPPAFVNALAVGKGNVFEDDDWELDVTSGPDLFAIALDLCDNAGYAQGESLSVYGPGGRLLKSTREVPHGASGSVSFFGIVSKTPIRKIVFDEDPLDDDIAIANFHFPRK